MNALEKYRREHGCTLMAMAHAVGYRSRSTILKQIRGDVGISAEAAIKYNRVFGIPLEELRPDLWPAKEVPDVQETSPDN